MALEVRFRLSARKELNHLPRADAERMEARLEAYALDPEAIGHDVVPIRGKPGRLRMRSGDWRAIFGRRDDQVLAVTVGHRGRFIDERRSQ